MRENAIVNDLTTGSVGKTLITFAFPLMLSNLLQTIYNMVDMIVVGQFVGKVGLSAVTIGGNLFQLFTFFAIGFANAGQAIISQYLGAGDKKAVSRAFGTMFSFIQSCAIVMTIVCCIFAKQLLMFMNTPQEAFKFGLDYTITCYLGLFFIYGYNIVSATLRGMGDSRHPFMFIAIAAGTNLVLDLLFIAVFNWEVFGAALATVIGQGVSFVWALIFLYKNREEFGFDFTLASFGIDQDIFRRLIKLGLPMCLQSTAIAFSVLFVNSFVNAYGVVASAVTGVGNKLAGILNVITLAFSTSGAAMVGQCLGAGKFNRIPKIIRTALIVNLIFASLLIFTTVLFPKTIFGLFNNEEEVLEMALSYVPCAVLMYLSNALRSPFMALINGSGQSKLNLAVGILDAIVSRIGLAILLGITFGWGIQGFWYGNAIAGFVPFLIGGVFFVSGKWKTQKLIIS
ncbi:MAG: MATE family efflux transporter [Firmicutes bacterium]|nr:MATE family efflux transporter [Bacillota bacterium]